MTYINKTIGLWDFVFCGIIDNRLDDFAEVFEQKQ